MRIAIPFLLMLCLPAWAELDYRNSGQLTPNDYLLGDHGNWNDSIFDQYRTVDLGAELGIGSDCGKINFTNTLRASLKNLLDAKYFGDMGKNIIAGSPMLLTCYFSPTWCSILKSMRVEANFLSQMRLDQCSLIDKYTDSRVEDFYRERQDCIHKAIETTGGDMEEAMEQCKNHWQANLSNWAGDKLGKSDTNRLLESSAKWQGMNDNDSNDLVNLVKSFVGDSVVSHGNVSVDYGPKKIVFTPRTFLNSLREEKYAALDKLIKNLEGSKKSAYGLSDSELKSINGETRSGVDRQTLQSLLYMPYHTREVALRKLADALAMPVFTEKMDQSLDFMTRVTQNVNLPDNRKKEAEQKRKALKEQIEMTMLLEGQKSQPLNQVLAQINSEGEEFEGVARDHRIQTNSAVRMDEQSKARLLDCSDPDDVFCTD